MFFNTAASSSWLAGFTVCFSLIVSIGAQNLYVLRQAVQGQHVRACVIWCAVCDAILVGVGVAGMAQIMSGSPTLARYLTLGGVLFLLAYGLFAWHRAFFAADQKLDADGSKAERSLLTVLSALAVITLANPHVYLDTVVLMGSIGAQQEGWAKWFFVIGAGSASLTWFVVLAVAGRRLRGVFANPKAWRVLDTLTGAMMFVLAWWVWQGLNAV